MAFSPNGLVATDTLSGGLWTNPTTTALIELTTANWYTPSVPGGVAPTGLGLGDPVTYSSGTDGYIVRTTNGVTGAGGVGTAGADILGVFGGCSYFTPQGLYTVSQTWTIGTPVLANTVPVAIIYTDPQIIFNVTVNQTASATVAAQSWIGQNINLYVTNFNAATGESTVGLDANTIGADANGQMKIQGVSTTAYNALGISNCILRCTINRSTNGNITPSR